MIHVRVNCSVLMCQPIDLITVNCFTPFLCNVDLKQNKTKCVVSSRCLKICCFKGIYLSSLQFI